MLNPTDIYLKQASEIPLLNGHQEIKLAQKIEKGLIAKRTLVRKRREATAIKKVNGLLSKGEKKHFRECVIILRNMITHGIVAEKKLAETNLRLVISIATGYLGKSPCFEMLDLIEEGNFGLLRAVKKFEWRRGLKFSTFATYKIRSAISYAIERHPKTVSLDSFSADEETENFISKMADKKTVSSVATVENNMLSEILKEEMSRLSTKQQLVLHMRFEMGKTIKEISEELHVTHQNIRGIINRALESLRDIPRLIRLNQ
jgi:RNA polymerase sigma factor (sigma-70 family)